MKNFLNKYMNSLSLSSIITLIFGIMLIVKPTIASNLLATIIAAVFIIKGGTGIYQYVNAGQYAPKVELYRNIALCVAGIFIRRRFARIVSMIPFIGGIYMLISSINEYKQYKMAAQNGYKHLKNSIGFVVIKFLFALALILNPYDSILTLLRVLGAALLYDGATGMVDVYLMQKDKNAATKAQNDLRDLNLNRKNYSNEE